MNIEINDYGFVLDSDLAYIALSWGLLIASTLLIAGYKAFKIWRNK